MNRISTTFANLKSQNRKALIPYLVAGDPKPEWTVEIMHALVTAGADLIEIGVPFSDPVADGPVIQAAHIRALEHKTFLPQIFKLITEFRLTNKATPIVLMTYLNPIEVMGYSKFVENASAAHIDGVLVVDMPFAAGKTFFKQLKIHNLIPIFLVAPNTSSERFKILSAAAEGYLYYVSVKGITGADHMDVAGVTHNLQNLRQLTSLPIAVGFGIRDGNSAAAIAKYADAVVVGSALVGQMAACEDDLARLLNVATSFTQELRVAMDKVTHPV